MGNCLQIRIIISIFAPKSLLLLLNLKTITNMKRIMRLFLLLLAAVLLPFTTMSAQDLWDGTVATEFAGGTGTEDDPYLIETGAQLAYLAEIANEDPSSTAGKYYQLIDDIVLNEDLLDDNYDLQQSNPRMWTPIVECSYYNQREFQGDFDGNGHVISGLYMVNDTYGVYIGLFGGIGGNAVIHDLAIVDSYMSQSYCGGLLVGEMYGNSLVTRCYVDARMTGGSQYTGILAGGIDYNQSAIIENCYTTGYNDGNDCQSALLGVMGSGAVRNCFTTGRVPSSNSRTGAFIGAVLGSGTYTNLYFDKTVSPNLKAVYSNDYETCYGMTTEEMQSPEFAELLGEPFVFEAGSYPYIDGLPLVGEQTAFVPSGHRINVGSGGSSLKFYSVFDGTNVSKSIRRAEVGETVYLKVVPRKRMLLTDGSLVVTNDETNQSITLTSVSENLWSFVMPDTTVTVTAGFHKDPNLPPLWDGSIAEAFAEGEGTEDEPYLISDGEELAYLAQLCNANGELTKGKYYELASDIVLNEDVLNDDFSLNGTPANIWTPIGKDNNNAFQGFFDGKNHKIEGVYIPSGDNAAFFGYTKNAKISNLSLIDTYISGYNNGGLVFNATATDTTIISNCYVEAHLVCTGSYRSAALVYLLGDKCGVENCYTNGQIDANWKGGLVYQMNAGSKVRNCYSAMKGATAIFSANDSVFNVYSDEDLGGAFSTRDDFCSKHTIEMHTTDFAKRMGAPFEYVLGNYPYIPGLMKIGENRGWTAPEDPTHGGAGGTWDGTTSIVFASGSGTEADPYIINNGAQLSYLAKLTNANGNLTKGRYYKLDADISLNADSVLTKEYDLNGTPTNIWEPIGKDGDHYFQGVFDGNDHKVSGVYIPSGDRAAFINYAKNATVCNLSLIDTYVAGNYSSALVNTTTATDTTIISRCFVEAFINASGRYYRSSGLVHDFGTKTGMENCYATGRLEAGYKAGLIYSMSSGSKVRNCYSAMKGATAIFSANDSVFNVYSDEDLGGAFSTRDDFCSKHTIEMHTTDFAKRMGAPFEYVLGNYPYIPGLMKIGENRGWTAPEDPTHGGAGGTWDGTTSIVFASGSGTEADPYIINNGAQLSYLAKLTNANGDLTKGRYYRLEADIKLNEQVLTDAYEVIETPSNIWEPIGKDGDHYFQGDFDGNNYTISGVYIPSGSNTAFFGFVNNAKVHNLSLIDTYVAGNYSSALIYATAATDTTIVKLCYVDAFVNASGRYYHSSGLIHNFGTKSGMENCYTTGRLEAGYKAGLIYSMSAGSKVRNCFTAMTGGYAIYSPSDSVFNVYFDSNRAGDTNNVRDDFRSAETPEMLSTDFATRMGEPFEYAVGYYPYIYGLHKIDSEGRTSIVTGYPLQLGRLENGSDCDIEFYRGYHKKHKTLSLPVVPGSKVFVDNATTIYVKVSPASLKRLSEDGLIVTANTTGTKLDVTEVDYDLYSFQITDDAVTVSAAFLDGNFCGDPEVNNGRDVKWVLNGDKSKMTIAGAGKMVVGNWIPFSNNVQTIEVGEGVTNIPAQAFKGMSKATTVTLPATVESIGAEAFSGCSATVDLRACIQLTALHANEFAQFTGTVYLPATVTTIEADAFAGTYTNVKHIYSPVVDGQTLYANDKQVHDTNGLGDVKDFGVTKNEAVALVWYTGYNVNIGTIAGTNCALKVYADEAMTTEIPNGYKAIREDDATKVYVKALPGTTSILFKNGLTVKAGSSTLTVTQEDDELFSFLMPKESVAISAKYVTGGYCGTAEVNNGHNLIWTLNNGTLAFQKNGFAKGDDLTMGDNAPWSTLGSSVAKVDLSGVTNIGSNAFSSCTTLTGIELPATPVLTVGTNAFAEQMWIIVPAKNWNNYLAASGWSAYEERMVKDKETLSLADGLQWRTYYSKVGRLLPSGIKAYTVSGIGNDEVMTGEALDYVPANQAVLIQNGQMTAQTIEASTSLDLYYEVPVCLLNTNEDNLLQWITEPTAVKVGQGYTLYKDEFVKVSTGTLPAGIAFLPAGGSTASRLGIICDGELTGVDAVLTTTDEGEWYTVDGKKLSGRPVKKGLYVKDGQKVVIR